MRVVIPSRGRAGKMRVLESLPRDLRTDIVVHYTERDEYHAHHGGVHRIHAINYEHIGQKRQQIVDKWGGEKLVMLDDDLRFRVRVDDRFERASPPQVGAMLRVIERNLDDRVHVGVADEFMCQHNPPGSRTGGRYNQVLGYNFVLARGHEAPRFRLAINEEHDVHLQLLRAGFEPLILTDYTKGSKYNAIGGCSTWRTPEFELQQFREFEALWPGVVSLRPNKSSLCGWSTAVAWRKVRNEER